MNSDKITEVLERGVEKIYPSTEALEKVLRSGKKIRLYQGFDPSMPNLHLGNTVGLLKLKQFQDLGHEVIMLIGDFTGMIGDPTDKSATRQQLTREEVLKNSQDWKKQANKILKFDGENAAKLLYNSQWLDKLSLHDLAVLASNTTYQQTIERDMFQNRIKEGKDIYLHEFFYPLMQAYDSVHMDVDLEIGGSDQMFNMLFGRDLMHKLKKKEKMVMTLKLLVDKEGNKVGKTAGNALFLNASAEEMFGGIMSFPDEAIIPGFELLTMVPMEKIEEYKEKMTKGTNPMEIKKLLALAIVAIHHGQKAAEIAKEDFEKAFQKRDTAPNTRTVSFTADALINVNVPELLVNTATVTTKGEAKRLIEQGGVDINNQRLKNPNAPVDLTDGSIIKVGKKKSLKIVIK